MKQYTHYVGVDIAATWADFGMGTNEQDIRSVGRYERNETGRVKAIARLSERGEPTTTLVVMEATGTYWMEWAAWLHEAGFAVSVVNAKHAHHFGKALRQRAKTDRLDALMLTRLALMTKPEPWTPPPPIFEELQQRLTMRDDLIKQRTQARNRLHALRQRASVIEAVEARLAAHIAYLDGEIKALEGEIAACLNDDPDWGASARRLLTIPGIGMLTAAWILTATQHFAGCTSPKAAASFAGLAPHPQQSGSSIHQQAVIGNGQGHADLRKALYMATMAGVRYNPILKVFYQRLIEAGKLSKVARCAAARKLLHIAWAVVVKERDFDPAFGPIDTPVLVAS